MNKYKVLVHTDQVDICCEIEADSEESARDKAYDWFNVSLGGTDWQIVQVEEIEDDDGTMTR